MPLEQARRDNLSALVGHANGRRGRSCVALLFAGLVLLLLAAPPALAQKPRAERPTYQVGDKWIRSDGVYDLIRIEKDLYVFAADGGREIHLTKNLEFTKGIVGGREDWEFDPPPRLGWPLEVGKWGTGTVNIRALKGGTPNPWLAKQQVTWKVEAYEDIDLAGDRFKAFRIGQTWQTMGWSAAAWTLTMWYVPEMGQFVRTQSDRLGSLNFQVVAFERPATTPLQVALNDPKDQARVAADAVVVTGKVTSGSGISRVSVTLNGREVSKQEGKTARKEVALNLPLKLQEGKNVLLVTATDAGGETRQQARTLFYERPAPVPAAPAPPAVAALPPLQVSITSPGDQARVDQESIALAGLASGGRGVSRVVVTLNGGEVARQTEVTPQPGLAVNVLLKLAEGQNTLVVTATDGTGAIQQEVRTLHYERLQPLVVAFRYPEDRMTVEQESSVVAALVTSSKGVASVRVILNGTEIHQQRERNPQKSVAVTLPVTLREGANAIALTASEPDGTVRQELRTVIYAKPQVAVATPAPPPPPKVTPDRWAVVVGVGRYEHPDIPKLRYTVPDADAIYQTLIGPAGFKKEHVLLLTDRTERKSTLRNIKWALGTFLSRSARKEDTVLIFFAGHGAPEVDSRGVERDGFSKYLVPLDAEPDDLYSTALPMDELQTVFARIEAERVVAFLDTCYSGAAGGRTFSSKKTRSSHLDDFFLDRLTRSKGRAILTASRPAEVSLELPELGHGIFTYYLVQGLKGAADLNRDGIVTLQELYEYLEQQVTQKSRAVGGNQHPVMKGELEGILPLVRVRP